jgi:hypothetical protein
MVDLYKNGASSYREIEGPNELPQGTLSKWVIYIDKLDKGEITPNGRKIKGKSKRRYNRKSKESPEKEFAEKSPHVESASFPTMNAIINKRKADWYFIQLLTKLTSDSDTLLNQVDDDQRVYAEKMFFQLAKFITSFPVLEEGEEIEDIEMNFDVDIIYK